MYPVDTRVSIKTSFLESAISSTFCTIRILDQEWSKNLLETSKWSLVVCELNPFHPLSHIQEDQDVVSAGDL